MKKAERNQIASTILDSFITTKYQNKYLEKTKALSSSKSVKVMSSLPTLENAFKKTNQKIEPHNDARNKKTKVQASRQLNLHPKHSNMSQKLENNEPNKFINNDSRQGFNNPQQFLARNQHFQKQKQLKLQFERRKQLYGITSDAKFKPSLAVSQHQENKNEETVDHEQKSKTYKEMYYKKYGKIKVEGECSKKKTKNYQDLMKESIARFQEKFKDLASNASISQSNQTYKQQQSSLSSHINESPQIQPEKSIENQKKVPNINEVDKKIKHLMQKLHIEDEFNSSIQSISELSRIQMQADAKQSEMNSSNLFKKEDEISIKDDPQVHFISSQIHESSFTQDRSKNPFISSLSMILHEASGHISTNEPAELNRQQHNYCFEEILQMPEQSFTPPNHMEIPICAVQVNPFYHPSQIVPQIPIKTEIEEGKLEVKPLEDSIIDNQQTHREQMNLGESQRCQEVDAGVQTVIQFQDIQILTQTVRINHKISSFSFQELQVPKIVYLKVCQSKPIVKNNDQFLIKHNQHQIKDEDQKEAQLKQIRPIDHRTEQLEDAQNIQNNETSSAQQQINPHRNEQIVVISDVQELQSSVIDYQCSTQIQSFLDLNGNMIEDACVEVQDFGYCRFLVIDEESEQLSQHSSSY